MTEKVVDTSLNQFRDIRYSLRKGISRLSPYVLAEKEGQLEFPKLDYDYTETKNRVKRVSKKFLDNPRNLQFKSNEFDFSSKAENVKPIQKYKEDLRLNGKPHIEELEEMNNGSMSLALESKSKSKFKNTELYSYQNEILRENSNSISISKSYDNKALDLDSLCKSNIENIESTNLPIKTRHNKRKRYNISPLENLKQSEKMYQNPSWPPRRSKPNNKANYRDRSKTRHEVYNSSKKSKIDVQNNHIQDPNQQQLIKVNDNHTEGVHSKESNIHSTELIKQLNKNHNNANIIKSNTKDSKINKTKTSLAFPDDPQFLKNIAVLCNGVSTKKSSLGRGSGLGLFADRNFDKNQIITEYCGTIIDRDTALQLRNLNASSHVIRVGMPHSYINGFQIPVPFIGGGSFANDGRKMTDGITLGPGNNAQHFVWFDHRRGRDRVFLKALKNIKCEDEIFIGYDNVYWKLENMQRV